MSHAKSISCIRHFLSLSPLYTVSVYADSVWSESKFTRYSRLHGLDEMRILRRIHFRLILGEPAYEMDTESCTEMLEAENDYSCVEEKGRNHTMAQERHHYCRNSNYEARNFGLALQNHCKTLHTVIIDLIYCNRSTVSRNFLTALLGAVQRCTLP
ncbi:hypothetical protein C8R43DRAFT_657784 [Mycena crocata]|nr:hypothetical protein C8R43DRAFT_657784 [Mycena crocata]